MRQSFKTEMVGAGHVEVSFNLEITPDSFSITDLDINTELGAGILKFPTFELYNDQWVLVNNHYKIESGLPSDDKQYLTHHAIANNIVESILAIVEIEKSKL